MSIAKPHKTIDKIGANTYTFKIFLVVFKKSLFNK
jgi:hypothetical protein